MTIQPQVPIWAALREKVPNVLGGPARPSFFWYDNAFLEYFSEKKIGWKIFDFFFFFENSVSYQKNGGRYDNDSGH